MPKHMDSKKIRVHDFYCLNCGARNIPMYRKTGALKEPAHRKKMYCPNCKKTVNHIECRNDEEAFDFREKFNNGEYEEEARESMEYIKQESGNILL